MAIVVLSASAASAASIAVSPADVKAWCQYLIPLPKSVEITSKVTVAASDVAIVEPVGADKVVAQAVKELKQALGQGDDAKVASAPAFSIDFVLGGPDSAKLKALKNSDQAYTIVPVADKGLKLEALTSKGLYYASKTLQQFIRARSSVGNVDVPLVTITDWPDLDERGLWGGDSAANLDWMAERKMNVTENISSRFVTRDGRGQSGPKDYWINAPAEAPIRAIKIVPAVLHLELVSGPYKDDKGEYTIFDIFPKLKATNGGEEGVICYSNPQFQDVLADWIVDLKNLPGVEEVSVWMTENLGGAGGCKCEECKKVDRSVLEMRTAIAAWKKAEQRLGKQFPLRILTSEETRSAEKEMFAEMLSEHVKLLYYDSLLTYTTGKAPMIDTDVENFIKGGGWASPVPNLSAFVRLVNPFTCPQFSHYRLNEFVDKGCSGLLGYACMGLKNSRFIVEGAAEWAWNAKGRTPEEFAYSWAVRQGLKDPAKFAEWNKLHSAVAWDMYGSDFPSKNPSSAERGGVATMIRNGKVPPLGWTQGPARGPWGEIKSIAHFDADLADQKKAVRLAKEMGIPEFYYESLVVDGYVRAMRAAYDLSLITKNGKILPGKQDQAAKLMKAYVDSLGQSADALPRWIQAISGGSLPTDLGSVEAVNNAINAMEKLATDWGLKLK